MTLRLWFVPFAFAGAVFVACEEPECTEDGDCKGRDVCEDFQCVDGPDATPEDAAEGFCELAKRCQPESYTEECEEAVRTQLESIESSPDPDCATYAQMLANLYACMEGSDCEGSLACLGDTEAVQEAMQACDTSAEGEGEGEGEGE